MSGHDWFICSRWGEYGLPGQPIPCPRSVPMPIVGGPRDGRRCVVPNGTSDVQYPIRLSDEYWGGASQAREGPPSYQEFRTGHLRVEKYLPHIMAQPVWRLVDDTARGALGLT